MTSNPRCGVCSSYHAPRCRATDRMWPSAPLLATPGAVGRLKRSDVPDMLDDRSADRWAVKLGLHPEQVWPGWCEAALTVSDDLFVNGGGWRQAWEYEEEQRSDEGWEPTEGPGSGGDRYGRRPATEWAGEQRRNEREQVA